MSTQNTPAPAYRRYALVAGIAMALGPLTALTVGSVNNEAGQTQVAGTTTTPSQQGNSTQRVAAAVEGKRLADVAASSGSLEFFSSVLDAAQVKELLRGQDQFTVFIPVNEAFSSLGGETLSTMLNDTDEVKRLAKAHVVPGRITVPELMAETRLNSINGHEISSESGPVLTVNGASIIGTEVAENGIVHYVDRIL